MLMSNGKGVMYINPFQMLPAEMPDAEQPLLEMEVA
jgi:hypothetical protein